MSKLANQNGAISGKKQCHHKNLRMLDTPEIEKIYSVVSQYVATYISDIHISQDLTQEIVLKIWTAVQGGKYKENGTFVAWYLRVAYNHVMDYFRRKQKQTDAPRSDLIDAGTFDYLSDQEGEAPVLEKRKHQLAMALSQLPVQEQKLVQLRMEEVPFRVIAEQTNTKLNTVLGRYRYTRIKLSQMLGAVKQ